MNTNSSCNENIMNENDCKMSNDLRDSNCNGKPSCLIQFSERYLTECQSNSNYLTVLFECVPGNII